MALSLSKRLKSSPLKAEGEALEWVLQAMSAKET